MCVCVLQLRATVPRSSPVGGVMYLFAVCQKKTRLCLETTNQTKAVNDELLDKSLRSFRRPPSNSKRTPSALGRRKVQTEVFCME